MLPDGVFRSEAALFLSESYRIANQRFPYSAKQYDIAGLPLMPIGDISEFAYRKWERRSRRSSRTWRSNLARVK